MRGLGPRFVTEICKVSCICTGQPFREGVRAFVGEAKDDQK